MNTNHSDHDETRLVGEFATRPIAPRWARHAVFLGGAGVAALASDLPDCLALLDAADRNLYLAKQQGRNRVVAGAGSADGPAGA